MNSTAPAQRNAPEPAQVASQAQCDSANLSVGLQLSRATTLALTRLQLAITNCDRQQMLAAMDRLDDLDTEMERLVERLPAPDNDDPAWQAMARHLRDQKLALTFEKLALMSGVSGPDIVSHAPIPASILPRPRDSSDPWAPAPAPVVELEVTDLSPLYRRIVGFLLALLATLGAAAAALLMVST